jgi:hypothetical protein
MFKARINAKPSLIGKGLAVEEKEEKPKVKKRKRVTRPKAEDEEIDFNDNKSDDEGAMSSGGDKNISDSEESSDSKMLSKDLPKELEKEEKKVPV